MNNYLELIEMMDYPKDYEVALAVLWLHPLNLPKGIISLGKFKDGFYKMPCYYTNYYDLNNKLLDNPITVPVISFAANLFQNNLEITDLILSIFNSRLQKNSFLNMKNLKRIWIPKKIKYIPKDCFKGCESLEEIYYEGSEEEFNEIEIYYKLNRVIPKLGLKDEIETYYDNGNLPFINAKKYFNQVRDVKQIRQAYIQIGNKKINIY